MNTEQLQLLIHKAEAANSKGDFTEADALCREVIAFLEIQDAADRDHLILWSRALSQISFSQRRRWLGLEKEALSTAREAYSKALEAESMIDTAQALSDIGAALHHLLEYDGALEMYRQSGELYEELGDTLGTATIKRYIGITYRKLGNYDRTLQYFAEALPIYEEIGDRALLAQITSELAEIYNIIGSSEVALEYYQRSLSLFQEIDDKKQIGGAIANIGAVYLAQGDYSNALEYFHKALAVLEEIGEQYFTAVITMNIGVVYFGQGELTYAMEYFKRTLGMYEQLKNKKGIATALGGIGEVYANEKYEGYDAEKAEEYLLKAIAINKELDSTINGDEYHALAKVYARQNRWEEAYIFFNHYHDLDKQNLLNVYNEKVQKQADAIVQQRQAAERDQQLAVERARAQSTEELLHKTLPKSIADRVIHGETHIADHFESVSVLFADIVGFTKISASMPPAAVLEFMNFIFAHFDALAELYGCERIKTIGDGYMAVCGAPVRYDDHAVRLARMALDMMHDIALPESIRRYLPEGTMFEMRIGVHCGEITAGLIGTGKLAYDIYGDTVNTASRMESHGEAGKIHCTQEFMHAVVGTGRDLSLRFIERREIEIKGKGMMNTYYVVHSK